MRDDTTTLNLIKHRIESARMAQQESVLAFAREAFEIVHKNFSSIAEYLQQPDMMSMNLRKDYDLEYFKRLLNECEQEDCLDKIREDLVKQISEYIEIMRDMTYRNS